MSDKKIDILGTEYSIIYRTPADYEDLQEDNGGICDGEKKVIVMNSDVSSESALHKSDLRHEIIHAYLYESGLSANWTHPEMGHDETYVDWVAIQFPKLLRTFTEVGCL